MKQHFHVFLSHNSEDKPAVEQLAIVLKNKHRLNPFLDKWNLVPGEPIEDALIKALENSDSAVIFVGNGGEGPWQSEEMRDILKRAVKSRNEFRAIPVLLPGASAEALEKSFLGSRLWIEFKDIDDDDALLRLAKAIQGEAYGGESFGLPDEPAPYRGLERFERIENLEQDFFFGRDDEIRALVDRLVKQRFVAVVGASGSGKSSLIRAGLTKQLAEEIHPGIRRWQTITVEPGSAPFRALAIQIAVAAGIPVGERETWIENRVQKWSSEPDGVHTSIETLFADAPEPLLLFIDQFEELFTHRREGSERERNVRGFVANLANIWKGSGDKVRIVVALRADFIERCLEISPLRELLQDRTMLVGEVGDNALREIVKEPAARVGAFLEKGLMERILTEVRTQSGSMPLLQQALHQLWRNRRGAWLTHDAWNAAGGVALALNDQAENTCKSLDDKQKRIADGLFLRLITLGDGVSDTRRRVKRDELYPEGVSPEAVDEVISRLSGKDARILVTTREGGGPENLAAGADFVEFTHEALLGNWEHLVRLLDSERESIRKHRTLTTTAEEWGTKPLDERHKFLLRAGQLVIAEQWATAEGGYARLNQLERRFLDESIDGRTAEEERNAKVSRRLKFLTIGATVAAAIAIGFGGFAFQQKEKAVANEEVANRAAITAQLELVGNAINNGEVSRALRLLESVEACPPSVRSFGWRFYYQYCTALLRRPSSVTVSDSDGQTHDINGVSISADGKTMATCGDDQTVRLWSVESQTELAMPVRGGAEVKCVALWPDQYSKTDNRSAQRVAWGARDGSGGVLRLKVSNGAVIMDPEASFRHADTVTSLAFSPDGKLLASTGDDGQVNILTLESQRPELLIQLKQPARGLAFSPDGTILVFGTADGMINVWNMIGERKLLKQFPCSIGGPNTTITCLVFDPRGDFLLSSGKDGVVNTWDVADWTKIDDSRDIRRHSHTVTSLSISPDGRQVASAGQDGVIHVWDLWPQTSAASKFSESQEAFGVAFVPGSRLLICGRGEGKITFRDLPADLSNGTILCDSQTDPNAAKIWAGSSGEHVALLDGGTLTHFTPFNSNPCRCKNVLAKAEGIGGLAITRDGNLLVTSRPDVAGVYVHDIDSCDPGEGISFPADRSANVIAIAMSPTENKLISIADDEGQGIVTRWIKESGTEAWKSESANDSTVGAAISIAFAADGSRFAVVGGNYSEDCRLPVWDMAMLKEIKSYKPDRYEACALSSTGGLLAAATSNGTLFLRAIDRGDEGNENVWLSNLNDLNPKNRATAIAFSPDDKTLAVADTDFIIRIIDTATGQLRARLRGHQSTIQLLRFRSSGDWLISCDSDSKIKLWSAAPVADGPNPSVSTTARSGN